MVNPSNSSLKNKSNSLKKKWYQREEICENCGLTGLPKKNKILMYVCAIIPLFLLVFVVFLSQNNILLENTISNMILVNLLILGSILLVLFLTFYFFLKSEKVIKKPLIK